MVRLIDCIEAVAFDLDGTLIDTAPDLAVAANSMNLYGQDLFARGPVGDSPSDIAAARAASCRVVAVTYGYGDHDVLAAACPDGLLGDLTKISSIRLRRGRTCLH